MPSSQASLIGAIATGRVLGACLGLALTALIGSGRHYTSSDLNIGLAADRARGVRASAPAIGC